VKEQSFLWLKSVLQARAPPGGDREVLVGPITCPSSVVAAAWPGLMRVPDQTMKLKRFTEEQINRIVRQHELGAICRKLEIRDATFYNSKSKSADWTCPKPGG
jgi:hypothetical protein